MDYLAYEIEIGKHNPIRKIVYAVNEQSDMFKDLTTEGLEKLELLMTGKFSGEQEYIYSIDDYNSYLEDGYYVEEVRDEGGKDISKELEV